MEKNNTKIIRINTLLAILEIENYANFAFELGLLVSETISPNLSKKAENRIQTIYNIAIGKFVIGNKKYKEFVKKYQNIFDIMKKYNCLKELTIFKYGITGIMYKSAYDNYFYFYLKMHESSIYIIKDNLIKLKQLGFTNIIFNEDFDFNETYEMRIYPEKIDISLSNFKYLQNMFVIPNYDNTRVKYRTNHSLYRMTLQFNERTNLAVPQDRFIELKSLIFDSRILPDKLTFEETVGKILRYHKEKANINNDIRNIIDFSCSIDELSSQYKVVKKILEKIDDTENMIELNSVLEQLSICLSKLKKQSLVYKEEILKADKNINEKVLLKGKKQ